MKKIKNIILPSIILICVITVSGYTKSSLNYKNNEAPKVIEAKDNQTINLFVTHGHCSTPFGGLVDNLKINTMLREDLGNPLENMEISFEVDPNSFNVCASEDLTEKIKTPGLFVSDNNEKIIFWSTQVYTMGIDWYQVNGKMLIKGVENDVKFFITGIRDANEIMPSTLVLEGQINLFDWGIDYDKIVNGKSDAIPNKLMYINMKIKMS